MAPEKSPYSYELKSLLDAALATGQHTNLETYLTERSNLPGPRSNLALIEVFAGLVGELVTPPGPAFPVERLEKLLDGWANLDLASAPVNRPREFLPACAVRSYGEVGVVRPDWWDDEITKLHRAASSPRWRTREMVAAALQKLLAADWSRTIAALDDWLLSDDPLVIRAVVGAVAEPPLLKDRHKASESLRLQVKALGWFEKQPAEWRKDEDMRTLRQALGYTLSVAVAAVPAEGWLWLQSLAGSADPDVAWIARENLRKNRLKKLVTGASAGA
jgi:hypothetical protein